MIKHFIEKGELVVIKDFISLDEENNILNNYKSTESTGKEKRNNIERYGSNLPYKGKMISYTIPDCYQDLCDKLIEKKVLRELPNSVTINEYHPGQIIKYHIDSKTSGQIITVISLLGSATMGFKNKTEEFFINFPPRALVQISGDLRWNWKHCILPVEEKRYSLVFRNSNLI